MNPEVFGTTAGWRHYRWQAVDHAGVDVTAIPDNVEENLNFFTKYSGDGRANFRPASKTGETALPTCSSCFRLSGSKITNLALTQLSR